MEEGEGETQTSADWSAKCTSACWRAVKVGLGLAPLGIRGAGRARPDPDRATVRVRSQAPDNRAGAGPITRRRLPLPGPEPSWLSLGLRLAPRFAGGAVPVRRLRRFAPARLGLLVFPAHGGEAGLERGHQVGRGVELLGLRLDRDLLAGGLALDQVEHLLAVFVVELRGLEFGRQRVDQLFGHLQLAVARR